MLKNDGNLYLPFEVQESSKINCFPLFNFAGSEIQMWSFNFLPAPYANHNSQVLWLLFCKFIGCKGLATFDICKSIRSLHLVQNCLNSFLQI